MLDRDGRFTWSDGNLAGGIRQDVTESVLRYRLIKNLNQAIRGALTKDKGCRRLYTTAPHGEAYDTKGAIDCRFNNGNQRVMLFLDNGTNIKAHLFNSDRTLTVQSPSFSRTVRSWHGMFANKLFVCDGDTLRAWDGSSWTTPGASNVNACRFGVVYASRLILFADPTYPYFFYPSSVRDGTVWDADLAVEVTEARGEAITGAATCGSYLLVGGETFLRAYQLGEASPVDWTWDSLSERLGPINWQSMVTINRAWGNDQQNFTMFWTKEGPYMAVQLAEGTPALISLAEPLKRSIHGKAYQGMPALDLGMYNVVEGVWAPEFNEVRFTVAQDGDSQHHQMLCVDVDSAAAYALNPGEGVYPYWRVRDNKNWTDGFPASTVFSCEVDPSTGLPSTSGMVRAFTGQRGLFWEMDAYADCKDDQAYGIPFYARRDGYDGADDGIQEHEKSVRGLHLRSTQVGDYDINVRVWGDSRYNSTATINLSNGLSLWTDNTGEGMWGNGGIWNEGEFVTERDDLGVRGQKFDVEVYDDGLVEASVEINSWSLHGYMEDRR